ncbi:helix-turn-helix transcriptional regulator [Kitasatospora sp. NPDC004289]
MSGMTGVGQQRRLQELGQFLRGRRARLSPDELGFAPSSRRRTPGLRREEVAVRAGVGTSWYTWVEQGRDINVSESVVRAISRALCLNATEEDYLFKLAGMPRLAKDTSAEGVLDQMRLAHVVDEWLPNPAFILDKFWNVLAVNAAVYEVFGFGEFNTNLLEVYFTDRISRSRYVDSDELARVTVAKFRASMAEHFGDPQLEALVESLQERSEEFRRLWHSHEVLDADHRLKEIDHPMVGRLSFDVHHWNLAANENVQLILHVPRRTSQTTQKLQRLLRAAQGDEPLADWDG